jgi:hypothetical protein
MKVVMKTNRWLIVLCAALVWLTGTSLMAQNYGGGNFDPAQMAARFQQFQQRIAQMDPAQMQEMAAQFMPGVAEMDPAQFQQMAERFQQGIGQMDPAMLQQMAEQFQQGIAQNFGNFDPSQFQPRRTADLREQMGITDDNEWTAVQALIQKVTDAQRVIQGDQTGAMMAFNRGANSVADLIGRAIQRSQGGQNGGQQSMSSLTTTSPEAEALRKAVENNAPGEETTNAVVKLRELRKAHQAALEKAQADLRKVLTLKQEAVATVNGLL